MKHSLLKFGQRALLFAGLLLLAAFSAHAQPSSGGPAPGATTAVPIDGGASLLLAGALAYGARRLRRLGAKARDTPPEFR